MTVDRPYDVVIAGRGGQGALFLARVIGEAAMHQGLGVRVTETHGMAMRGGSVLGFVRLGDALGPLFRRGTGALLLALHEEEAATGIGYLSPNGTAVVNTDRAAAGMDRTAVEVDADGLAESVGHLRSANLALLGAAAARVEGFPLQVASLESAILALGAKNARLNNLEVFRLGLEDVRRKT